jgi:hypothetical protein
MYLCLVAQNTPHPTPAANPATPRAPCLILNYNPIYRLAFSRCPEEWASKKVSIVRLNDAVAVLVCPVLENILRPAEVPDYRAYSYHNHDKERYYFHALSIQTKLDWAIIFARFLDVEFKTRSASLVSSRHIEPT